ncbi:hypothetical protein CLOM_g4232 [Closterium sp. NIES-68]|nr:hypothetical protein CLOM_g4232 [Closterium sp. NIES-68]
MSAQHFIVYWAAPTAGAVLAAAFYRIYLKPHKAALEAKRKKEKAEEEKPMVATEAKVIEGKEEDGKLRKRVVAGARGEAEVNGGGADGAGVGESEGKSRRKGD